MRCRTESLGGHSVYCENGHLNGVWYNSCKHRSCPQCNRIQMENWLQQTQDRVLDCPHHHWVFTLPHDLHSIWHYNRVLCQTFLFQAVRETLLTLCQDKRYLTAKPAAILALHTWARNLTFHPHIHCLISHGGLDDDGHWQLPKRKSFLPAKVMMQLFRGKYLNKLRLALKSNELKVPRGDTPQTLMNLFNKWGRLDWVVHCAKTYEHGNGVVKYLSRYIRGGAIKNNQLLNFTGTNVRISYQSHQTQRREFLTLSHQDLIQRILAHIALPKKPQYQYMGLYHSRCAEKLNQARAEWGQIAVSQSKEIRWQDLMKQGQQVSCCKECGSPLSRLEKLNMEVNKQLELRLH